MKLSRILRTTLACLATFGLALAVSAQNEIVKKLPAEYNANSDFISPKDLEADPRSSKNVLSRYAEELNAGRFAFVLRALADDFRADSWPTQAEAKLKFQEHLDRLVLRFEKLQAEAAQKDSLETEAQRDALLALLNKEGLGWQSMLPEIIRDGGSQVLVFFASNQGIGPSTIVSYRPAPDGLELLVPQALMRDMRLRAEAVRAVLAEFSKSATDRAVDQLRLADTGWRNYLENGYSQYPWEAYINGKWLPFDAFHPPEAQFIVLHPAIGFEVSTTSLDEINMNDVLSVELFGYLSYWGNNEHYLGGAITTTLRDDMGPGFGLVAHWDKALSLGVTWHDVDDNGKFFDDDPFLFLSVDLFQFVQGQGEKFNTEYGRVRSLLGK